MAHEDIVQYQFRSGDEAQENGRKGGIASGAARRRKRSLKDAADLYLSLPVTDRRRWNKIARKQVEPEDIDNQMAMIIGLTEAATMGDARAAKVIIDLIGEDRHGDDPGRANNLLDAIRQSAEEIDTNDIPEIQ